MIIICILSYILLGFINFFVVRAYDDAKQWKYGKRVEETDVIIILGFAFAPLFSTWYILKGLFFLGKYFYKKSTILELIVGNIQNVFSILHNKSVALLRKII